MFKFEEDLQNIDEKKIKKEINEELYSDGFLLVSNRLSYDKGNVKKGVISNIFNSINNITNSIYDYAKSI